MMQMAIRHARQDIMSHGQASERASAAAMNAWIRQSQAARRLFGLLLLCVLAIRVAIPSGFMASQSAHGIVISMCTGMGAVKAVLPIARQDGSSDHHKKSSGECTFAAGLGGLLASSAIDHLAPAIILTPLVASRAIADLAVHWLAAPKPPSQPPARA